MIELKNISKSFGERTIIEDVSASMIAGKCNLIIGTSGSGKTVLTKCMVGLFKPEIGQILFNGKDMLLMDNNERKELRRQIGMLFQGTALFDSMTVEENVLFPLNMFTNWTSAEKKKRVDEVLARVNLVDAHKRYPSEISGGMKKRVGIARAIVLNPKYLFCDEPNSGLDPQTSMVIDKLIQEITAEFNITTIVVTHDMNSVMEIGDNILFIHNGNNWWTGNKNNIISTENPEVTSFVYASEFMKEIKDSIIEKNKNK